MDNEFRDFIAKERDEVQKLTEYPTGVRHTEDLDEFLEFLDSLDVEYSVEVIKSAANRDEIIKAMEAALNTYAPYGEVEEVKKRAEAKRAAKIEKVINALWDGANELHQNIDALDKEIVRIDFERSTAGKIHELALERQRQHGGSYHKNYAAVLDAEPELYDKCLAEREQAIQLHEFRENRRRRGD